MSVSPITDLPPLENGDCLTRQEFERRYTAMAHIKKAELIEGVASVASPGIWFIPKNCYSTFSSQSCSS
jgi:hypothetical protein